MKRQFIACIYIGDIRTKVSLVEATDGKVLETIVSQTENRDIGKFLCLVEQALEMMQIKIVSLKGTISEICVSLPVLSSDMEGLMPFAAEFMEHSLLKNIIERRFLLPCRVFTESYTSE